MKKYLIVVAVVVIGLIFLSYYGDISDENEKKRLFEESRKEKQTESGMDKLLNDIQYYEKHPELLITIEAAVEDYNFMWQTLENYYPYFGVAERLYGVKYQEIKEKYLQEIQSKSGLGLVPPNKTWFGDIIKKCFAEFKHLGHLEFMPSSYSVDTEYKIDDFNVTHKILDENTAYIKLQARSGGAEQFEYDYNKVMNFYSEIRDYENLIVDMTQYSGGDTYWVNFIVEPNITLGIGNYQYFCAKDGSFDIDFLRSKYPDFRISETDMDLSLIPDINQDDLQMFNKLYIQKRVIYPTGNNNKKMFSGNIYVLIDKNTNPVTEDIAAFCKNTGFAEIVGRKTETVFSTEYITNYILSESGFMFGYCPLYLLNSDGSCNAEYGTEPDYVCINRESPLDACLRIIAGKNPVKTEHVKESED